jgi:hypothetical protein
MTPEQTMLPAVAAQPLALLPAALHSMTGQHLVLMPFLEQAVVWWPESKANEEATDNQTSKHNIT